MPTSLSLADLETQAEGWLFDCEIRQLSPATIALRRIILGKLLWFLRHEGFIGCDTTAGSRCRRSSTRHGTPPAPRSMRA